MTRLYYLLEVKADINNPNDIDKMQLNILPSSIHALKKKNKYIYSYDEALQNILFVLNNEINQHMIFGLVLQVDSYKTLDISLKLKKETVLNNLVKSLKASLKKYMGTITKLESILNTKW